MVPILQIASLQKNPDALKDRLASTISSIHTTANSSPFCLNVNFLVQEELLPACDRPGCLQLILARIIAGNARLPRAASGAASALRISHVQVDGCGDQIEATMMSIQDKPIVIPLTSPSTFVDCSTAF